MALQTSQVFSQKTWPAAGDIDDCWVVATLWCANAVAPWLYLHNVTEFRRAAGDPDDGKTDGGRLDEIMLACDTLWPQLRVNPYRGSWKGLQALIDTGHPASVAVVAELLPPRLQFGFKGLHQVVFFREAGRLKCMNPLAKDRSRPDFISYDDARAAARAFTTDGTVRAAVFPVERAAFQTHPLYVAPVPCPEPPPPADCSDVQAELDRALDAAAQAIVVLGGTPPA